MLLSMLWRNNRYQGWTIPSDMVYSSCLHTFTMKSNTYIMQDHTEGCWVQEGAVSGLMNLQIISEIHRGH